MDPTLGSLAVVSVIRVYQYHKLYRAIQFKTLNLDITYAIV